MDIDFSALYDMMNQMGEPLTLQDFIDNGNNPEIMSLMKKAINIICEDIYNNLDENKIQQVLSDNQLLTEQQIKQFNLSSYYSYHFVREVLPFNARELIIKACNQVADKLDKFYDDSKFSVQDACIYYDIRYMNDTDYTKINQYIIQQLKKFKTNNADSLLTLDEFFQYLKESDQIEQMIYNLIFSLGSKIYSSEQNAEKIITQLKQYSLPKSKIFNSDIIDYIKYDLLSLANIRPHDYLFRDAAKKYGKLPNAFSIDKVWIKFLEPYRSRIKGHKDCVSLYKRINNHFIADLYGKSNNPQDLASINDKVGDTIQLKGQAIVDVDKRDYIIVYINGEWLQRKDAPDVWHSKLISDYLSKKINKDVDFHNQKFYDADEIVNSTVAEVDDETLIKQIESKPLLFGNLQGNIGFLISAKNISKKQAAELIKAKFNVKKVYFQQQRQYKFTRLAKLIK